MVRVLRAFLPLILFLGTATPLLGQEPLTLERLLEMGRENSPTVRALRAAQKAVEAGRRDSGRWDNPELEFEWGTGKPFAGTGDLSVNGFTASQRLENPFSRHFRMGALRAEEDAAAEDVREGVLEVEYQIREHFYRILFLEEVVELAALNEEALAEVRTLIETRARLGEVRELEAIRLRVEHLRALNELEAARIELDQFRQHLNTFLGNQLPADFEITGPLSADPTLPDLETLYREALPNHPSLVRAETERRGAEQSLKESQASWIPDPTIYYSSSREMEGDIQKFGVGLSLPLWNQSRAASEASKQALQMAELRKEALQLEMQAQLMIHHNHLRLAQRTLALFEEGLLTEAETSMGIAESSYREGEISLMEYLDSRRTYHSIQIQRQEALFEWNVERAALDRAAGGGTR
jgi:cobalt-zinc-cadmium efflux system outer membrane protein